METRPASLEVLVLCSSPVGDLATLKLPHELTEIENRLRKAQVSVRMKRVFPPTIDQLRRELAAMSQRGDQPGVFHFLGHGDDDGLYFEDEFGRSQLVKGSELKSALNESPVKLVLLNACWSATKRGVSLVEFLQREKVTETAIGHELPVADVSAVKFAQKFYELAMSGKSVRVACQQAANSLAEAGLPGAADVKLVGNGELKLTDGLPVGPQAFVSDDGLPTIGNLPDASVFFGRREQLVEIARALSDSSLVGVGVWGIGGIGKTALVLNAARRNAWRYRGTAWIDIREATQKTTVELLRIALGRLSPGANSDDPQHALSQFLKGTPSLIVLDNLEDLPESEVPALGRFLKQIPRNGSHVMLTARVPLQPVEEVPDMTSIKLTEGLDGWHGPHYVQHVARQKKCLALQDELRVNHGELETTITGLEGLCVLVSQRLHGHPKMLELAVGLALQGEKWLNDALASLPEHLEDQLAPLLATSFAALGDDGQRLLPLLSFFPTGRLTLEALQVVAKEAFADESDTEIDDDETPLGLSQGLGGLCASPTSGASSSSAEAVEPLGQAQGRLVEWFPRAVQQLAQAGLLDYDQATDTYLFHQSILDAASRSAQAGELVGQIMARLLVHYAEYFASNTENYDAIERCFDNAMLLMERFWSMRTEAGPLDRGLIGMVFNIGYYFEHRGQGRLGQSWHERVIELHRVTDDGTDADLTAELARQASLLASRGDPAGARALLNEALQRAEASAHQPHLSALLHELAIVESAQGNPVAARRLLQRSLTTKESLGDQHGLAASLHVLAILESAQGNPVEARRLLQRSLTIFESLGDQRGLSASLHVLASLESDQGNPVEARRLLQRSLTIKESLGDQRGLASSLHQLANLEIQTGNRAAAKRLWERSIAITQAIGDVAGGAATMAQLAKLEALEGHGERALELAREAVRQLESLGYAQAEQVRGVLRDIEQFLVNGGRGAEEAPALIAALQQQIAAWQPLDPAARATQLARLVPSDPQTAVLTWLAQSVVCFGASDLAGCEAAEAQAHSLATASGKAELVALVETLRRQRLAAGTPAASAFQQSLQAARQQLQAEQPAEALPLLEQAVAQARQEQQPLGIATAQFYLGQVLLMLHRPPEAVTVLREALDLATEADEGELIKAIQQVLTVAVQRAK